MMFRTMVGTVGLAVVCLSGPVFATAKGASEDHNPVSEARLLYIDGDYEAALKIIRPAAEAGDANAQNILADAYDDGNGITQDHELALEWWKRSAEQDFPKALHNLGRFYEKGRPGIEVDFDKAVHYYDRAVELDYVASVNNRGVMHELGQGGPQDYAKAVAMYERGIAGGDSDSMNNLGLFHIRGTGVEVDYPRALELFQMSAAQGDTDAISNLGAMYDNGYAVEKDTTAALALFQMAAFRGDLNGATNMAYALFDDSSSFYNPSLGYAWCLSALDRATGTDLDDVTGDCNGLEDYLTDEIRANAKAIAPNLVP